MDELSRGVERREYRDKRTGRAITQVTCNAEFESKHSYYDICPWSSDDKYLAFSSARGSDLTGSRQDNVCTGKGHICVMDTATGEIRVIATDACHTSHGAAWTMWLPDSHVLTFRRADGTAIVDLDTGRESAMPGGMRQVSPDGTLGVGAPSQDAGEQDGVYTMNVDGTDPRCLVTKQHLYELTPNRDQFPIADMSVGNMKWRPDSQSLLVAMWVKPRPAVRRSLYIVSRDGTECRWLTHMAHHHSWTPDGRAVLFNDYLVHRADGTKADPRMQLVDFDGTNHRVVIDRAVGSHPIMHPGGRLVGDFDGDGVYIVDVQEQRVERLAEFSGRFDMSHRGTHPHCVWRPDGSELLYNSAESGHSELYAVRL